VPPPVLPLPRADWPAAPRPPRLGPLFAAALLIQIPYRLYGLRRRDPEPLGRLVPTLFGCFLIIALIGNWIDIQRTRTAAATSAGRAEGARRNTSPAPFPLHREAGTWS